MNKLRCIFGFLLAPWAAPLCLISVIVVVGDIQLHEALLLGGITLVVSYVGSLILGLPIVQLLSKRGALNLRSLVGSGIVGGILVVFVFGWLRDGLLVSMAYFDWLTAVWGGGLGFSVALAFGLIAGVTDRGIGSEDT